MTGLANKSCVPCKGGVSPLTGEGLSDLAKQLPAWTVEAEHHLEREYTFADFAQALVFLNAAAEIAESEGHHPDFYLAWGKVSVKLWTHKIDGLTESDFVLAAKIEELPR